MEKEMAAVGVIKTSKNPWVVPEVLDKKDGSWGDYVDYQSLDILTLERLQHTLMTPWTSLLSWRG